MKRSHRILLFLGIGAVSLALQFGLGLTLGMKRQMESDAMYYFRLAVSLSRGNGYVLDRGFWPDNPTMSRMPGWPATVAAALKVSHTRRPAIMMRSLNYVINAAAAVSVAMLAWVLFRRAAPAALGGLAYACYPIGILTADEGLSEPLFILLAVAGTLLVLAGLSRAAVERLGPARVLSAWFGFLLLGLSCLVRSNFILWIGFFGLGVGIWSLRAGLWRLPGWWAILAVGAILFSLPSLGWAARNYRICHHFPVLNTLRGQTYYGGNNPLVANDFHYWGYWVFPNQIPGETPMYDLSLTMSEYEVDQYYYDKGVAFLRDNPRRIPWMLLGKFVRAYIPIPWNVSPASLALAALRTVFYLFALWGLFRFWSTFSPLFRVILAAMILTNLAMVLMFYGYSRFAFALEPFFMPIAAAAAAQAALRVLPSLKPEPRNLNPLPIPPPWM